MLSGFLVEAPHHCTAGNQFSSEFKGENDSLITKRLKCPSLDHHREKNILLLSEK